MTHIPLLSVVVPFYNSEDFLRKCVQSILIQSFQDFELILVDDGSTDGSCLISDELGINNNNVIVIHHDRNQGLLAARLTGARMAKGHYLTFVDSDDYIDVDYFDKFASVISCYPDIDVICGGYMMDYGNVCKTIIPNLKEGFYCCESKQDLNNRFFSYPNTIKLEIAPNVWNKWFRRPFILPFIERADNRITFGEDAVVSFFSIIMADKVFLLNDAIGYHYLQHPNMMTRKLPNDYYERVRYFIEYVDRTIKELNLHKYQPQFDRHKLYLYNKGFMDMSGQKDRIPLIDMVSHSKAFRDTIKAIHLFRVCGLSLGAKLRIWMIYHHKVSLSYKIQSIYLWF